MELNINLNNLDNSQVEYAQALMTQAGDLSSKWNDRPHRFIGISHAELSFAIDQQVAKGPMAFPTAIRTILHFGHSFPSTVFAEAIYFRAVRSLSYWAAQKFGPAWNW